ncbi:hypothetical protein T484DRAFT_1777512 [Baffinella frigidus]|nr:hypothetical protein T484DRAFT_1777512 [Cryptophyta sp. CCMP2293]
MAIAALRISSKGSVFGSRAAPRGALLPGRPASAAFASLTVVTAQLPQGHPRLSLGGGARSRRLMSSGSRGGSSVDSGIQDRQLTAWIKQKQDTIRGLLWLLEEHGQRLNAIHVGAVWAALAKMRSDRERGPEKIVLQQLQVVTRATLQDMEARGLTNVVLSMANLYERGRRPLFHGGRALVPGDHNGFGDKLALEMMARAAATAGDFEAQDVSNFVWGLAKMSLTPGRSPLEAMQERATATAGDFPPQAVTNLVWGLAKMGVQADAALLAAMQKRAAETAGDFPLREIATLLWALEKMGVKNPDADLVEAMQRRATATADEFMPQEIVNLISALAAVGVTNLDAGFLEAIQQRVRATARDFKAHTVVSLMSALAKMDTPPEAALVKAMLRRAWATAKDFKPQDVEALMSTLATMGIEPDPGLLSHMEKMRQARHAARGRFGELTGVMERVRSGRASPSVSASVRCFE